MNCPKCAKVLDRVDYEGVNVDSCPGCHGEWLDAGELQQLVDRWEKKFTPQEVSELKAIDKAKFTLDGRGEATSCPKCAYTRLERFNYASTSGIALEKCPGCRGIWFDDKELEHVQILAEEWSKKLGEDLVTHGGLYAKVRAETEARVDQAASVSRFGIFNTILRQLF